MGSKEPESRAIVWAHAWESEGMREYENTHFFGKEIISSLLRGLSPQNHRVTEMRANTVLFLGAIHLKQHAGISILLFLLLSWEHLALLFAPCLAHHGLTMSLWRHYSPEWNSTQRGEGCTGLQPKGLATQITPGPFPWPFHLWGNILTSSLSLKIGLLFHLDFSLTTKNAYGPPHTLYLWFGNSP